MAKTNLYGKNSNLDNLISKDDYELILLLLAERRILKEQLSQLTNAAIAQKFEVTTQEIARISKVEQFAIQKLLRNQSRAKKHMHKEHAKMERKRAPITQPKDFAE